MATDIYDLHYEVLAGEEVVFSSSDMDVAVSEYNERVLKAMQSRDWVALRKVVNTNEDSNTASSSRIILEYNRKEPAKEVKTKRISAPTIRSSSGKSNVRETLGGLDYRDVELILSLRQYARKKGHCNVPADDRDHSYIKGLGSFVARLKKEHQEDSNHPLVSKAVQVVPELHDVLQSHRNEN
jgi:ribosomal protein S8